MTSTQKKIRRVTLLLVLLVLIGYGIFESRNLIRGPQIAITSPITGSAIAASVTTVTGTVENINYIALNDHPIPIDQNNKFSESVVLAEGYNVFEVTVRDRFGRERTEMLELTRTQ